jgi:ABC-type transport system substrate-binding protein
VCTALALGVVLAAAGCTGHRLAHAYPLGSQSGGPPRPGGHAVFVREGDQDYIDPALSYELYSSPVVMGVNRMLLDYVNEPGVAGTRRVPGLATSLPTVTEDGTLYAFCVRPDARFAQPIGRHIVAADFKYALERLFRVGSPGVDFFRHIVGAGDVLAGRDTALAGVIARGDSLYIRLERPDPVFLSVLSMTFAAPLPREAVPAVGAFPTTIASGPFRIAEFSPRQRVVLVKNPAYCGSPAWLDTVEVRFGVTTSNGVAMIRRGAADGGLFEVPAAEYGRLHNDPSWRPQLDVADGLNTTFIFMNVRMKPFNDVRVRQAVAWAVDRRIAVKTYSGKASIAGEVLPPSMPGSLALGRYPRPGPGARATPAGGSGLPARVLDDAVRGHGGAVATTRHRDPAGAGRDRHSRNARLQRVQHLLCHDRRHDPPRAVRPVRVVRGLPGSVQLLRHAAERS